MKVLLVEVCRSPEYDKGDTEAVFLSRLFERWEVPYTLFSNDGVPEPGRELAGRRGPLANTSSLVSAEITRGSESLVDT